MLKDKYKIILIKLDSFNESKEYHVSPFKIFAIMSLIIFFFTINLYFFSDDIFINRDKNKAVVENLSSVLNTQNNQLIEIEVWLTNIKLPNR